MEYYFLDVNNRTDIIHPRGPSIRVNLQSYFNFFTTDERVQIGNCVIVRTYMAQCVSFINICSNVLL